MQLNPHTPTSQQVLTLDCHVVRHFMPHRFTMMLLDRVSAYYVDEQRLVGIKNVAQNDPLVQGHYPDYPVFPGALLVESLAQSCGALMNLEYARQQGIALERLHEAGFLASLPPIPMTVLVDSKIKQVGVAYPGDQIVLETSLTFRHAAMCHFQVQARVEEAKIAEGEIMLAYPPYTE